MLSVLKKIDIWNISLLFVIMSFSLFFKFYANYQKPAYTEISVYKVSSRDPLTITFRDKRVSTKIYQKNDGLYWIDFDKEGVKQSFLANSETQKFLEVFRNLKSFKKIVLREEDAPSLVEFGLRPPQAQLRVADLTKEIKMDVGSRNYASNEIYLRTASASDVFLLNSGFFHTLANPQNKLKLYTPYYFNFEELSRVEAHLNHRESKVTKVLQHQEYNDQGELIWTMQDDHQKSGLAAAWIDALAKMQIVAMSEQDLAQAVKLLRVDFYRGSAILDSLQIWSKAGLFYGVTHKISQPMELNTTRVQSLLAAFDNL